MKFLHISDLHLGKRVNEFSMTEDQKYILKQILYIGEQEQTDGVLLAGDIYDKPVPSAEAVQIFDWFLTGLADRGMKVFAVSGNHDSPERVAFGAQLMQGRGVYLSPVYEGDITGIPLQDQYGELSVYLLPFVKPALVRHALENEPEARIPESYQDAVRIAVERMKIDVKKRNLLVAHQFVTGAGRCDSEEASVGGLDNVDGAVFDDFDYVALGHIHSPQSVGRESIRYCGTPLKYSFSEAEQIKSVTVVEMGEKGNVRISTVPQVTLTDEEDVPDALQKLRIIYPNLMRLAYDNSRTRQDREVEAALAVEQKSELELLGEFYELQNNQPMSGEQAAFAEALIRELKGEHAL